MGDPAKTHPALWCARATLARNATLFNPAVGTPVLLGYRLPQGIFCDLFCLLIDHFD